MFYEKLTEQTELPKTVTLSTDVHYSDSCDSHIFVYLHCCNVRGLILVTNYCRAIG